MIGFVVRLYKSFKYLGNSTLVLSMEYSRGVEDALDGFKKAQLKAVNTIADMVEEGEDRQDSLRKTYTSRIDAVDKTWNIRCQLCKQYVEKERTRLRAMQRFISRFTSDFTDVYASLLKELASVREANDKILIGSARMKDSESRLETLKRMADKLITEAEPVMRLTEEDLSAKERNGKHLPDYKSGSPSSDGRSGGSTKVIPQ